MPLVSLKTHADFLNASVGPEVSWDLDGNAFLTPKNFWPNQYMSDFAEDGEPVGWALRAGLAEPVVGHHVNVSRPGKPAKTSITRQTTSHLPVTEAKWKADGPIIPGARSKGSDKRKPPAPTVEVAPVAARGFTGGRYAYAWGTSDKNGRPTTTTDWCYFTLANNQRPIIPVPDSFNEGSVYWDLYMTKVGGGPATGALQRKVPISQLAGLDEYLLRGPWENRGPVPTRNLSGVGTTPAPVVGRDARVAPAIPAFDLKAGFWTLFYQLKNARGPGLLSPPSKTIPVKGTRERRVKEPDAGAIAQGFARVDGYRVNASGGLDPTPAGDGGNGAGGNGNPPTAQGFPDDDPRNIRPSGKLPGNEYLGEENDLGEARLIGLLNEVRRATGVPDLIVSQVMNRTAYRRALGEQQPVLEMSREEGYEGERLEHFLAYADHPEEASISVEAVLDLADSRWRAVGVARETPGEWHLVLGEPIEDPSYDVAELVCETINPDGTVEAHTAGDVHADVSLGWNNVVTLEDGSKAMHYSYSGSYGASVSLAAQRTHDLGVVSVLNRPNAAGIQVRVADGSLPNGIYGRAYDDGRLVLNAYYYSKATSNANNTCSIHEFWHHLGFGHVDPPSVLNPSINTSVSTNHERPTSYDVSEYRRVYGQQAAPQPAPEPPPPSSPPPSSPPSPTPVPPPAPKPVAAPRPEPSPPPEPTPQEPDDTSVQASRQNPYPGMISRDKRPSIGVLLKRASGGITKSQLRLFFDKKEIAAGSFSFSSGFLSYLPPAELAGGSHSVTVVVAGAEVTEVSWSFEVEVAVEYEWVPGDYMDGHGIHVRVPRAAFHPDVDYAPWLRYEPPVGVEGGVEFYRAYLRRDPAGAARYFYGTEKPPVVHGYPPEKEPTGLRVGLVAENPPLVDESVVEAPDPNGVPDVPTPTGTPTPPAGTYLVTVHGVLESGKLTQESEPTSVTINGTSETFSVSPVRTVNLLPNAEFSQLDAQGKPEDWTPVNAGPGLPGSYSVSDGVLSLETPSQTVANPAFESARIPVSQETVLTVAGQLSASRVLAGTARVVLREYRADGGVVRDTILASLTEIGAVPFSRLYGPNGTVYHADTSHVSVQPRMAGPSVNLSMKAWDLQLLPFASDLRRVEFAASGSKEPDNFDASPSTPLSPRSFVAYGLAPTPPGGDLPESEKPVEVVNFEGGVLPAGWATNAGTPASRVVEEAAAIHEKFGLRIQDAASSQVQTFWISKSFPAMDGKSFGLRSLIRIPQRPTHGYVTLMLVLDRPGTRAIASLRYYSDGKLELVYFYPNRTGAGSSATKTVLLGVAQGSTLDAEIVAAGGGTKNGTVTFSASLNGETRNLIYAVGSINYVNVAIGTALVGVNHASDSRAVWQFHYDQIVVTKNGDVLNRERPPAPSGSVPPAPDRPRRPLAAWAPKTLYAVGDERIPVPFGAAYNGHAYKATPGTSGPNRPAFPTRAEETVRDNAGLLAVTRSTAYALGSCVLKPGGLSSDAEWYEVTGLTAGAASATTDAAAPAYPVTAGTTVTDGTAILTTRKTVVWTEAGTSYRVFEPDGARIGQAYVFVAPGEGPITTDLLKRPIAVKPGMSYTDALFRRWNVFGEAAPGIRVWLEGEGVEPLLAASFGEMAGSRGWHRSGEEDDFVTYAVPEAKRDERGNLLPFYSRVRYEAVLAEGVYVFQESLHAQGLYPDFASRDAMRGYGRASSGELSVDLPTHPPAFRARGALVPDTHWSDFGTTLARDIDASENLDDGVEVLFSTSHDGVAYSFETDDKALVYPESFLRQRIRLTGDGRNGPVIPAGGVHLRTWHDEAVLLRGDGSHFPGVATIPNVLWTEETPDSRFDRVGGRVYVVELTEAVERMGGITIQVATERALKEIAAMSARGETFQAEIPGAEDSEGGISYELKLGEKANFDAYDVPPALVRDEGSTDDVRVLWAAAEIGEAEVVEGAPLGGPIELRGVA